MAAVIPDLHEYASTVCGIVQFALDSRRGFAQLARTAASRGDMENHDICAAKAAAFGAVLKLATGRRECDEAQEIIDAAMGKHRKAVESTP